MRRDWMGEHNIRIAAVLVASTLLGCDANSTAPANHRSGQPPSGAVFIHPEEGAVSISGWDSFDDKQRAEFDALRGEARYRDGVERVKRVSERPPLRIAFVDRPLPGDVLAVVRLGQVAPVERYAVVSIVDFDDAVYMQAILQAFAFEMRHEEDRGPVTITITRSGAIEWVSDRSGNSVVMTRGSGQLKDRHRKSRELLGKLSNARPIEVPGFGMGRLVDP